MRTTKKAKVWKSVKVEESAYNLLKKMAKVRGLSVSEIISRLVLNINDHEK